MIVCPACAFRNPYDAQVCQACGRSLEHFVYRACPSCGALNPASNVFCHRCFDELVPEKVEAAGRAEDLRVEPLVPPKPRPRDLGEQVLAEEAPPPEAQAGWEALAPVGETEPAVGPDLDETVAEAPEPPREIEATPPPESRAVGHEPADLLRALEIEPEAGEPPEAVAEAPEEMLEDWDGLVSIAPGISQPHPLTLPTPRSASEDEEQEAELFHRIASERGPLQDALRVVIPRQARLLPRWGRTLLYLLVLLVALVPALIGSQTSALVRPRDSVRALASTIEGLPAGSAVLLSFDYGPTYAGEMDALALALVRHLLTRQARVVAMSTNPGGVGLAERVFRTVCDQIPDCQYGETYAILGYLPGPEVGLRTLYTSMENAFKVDQVHGRPLNELPATKNLHRIADYDQVIILADDSRIVQSWIEQVQSRGDVDLHALVTAATEPMLYPYQQSGQLLTLVAGAHSAGEYEMASGSEGAALQLTDAYAGFWLVLLLTAIATNVVHLRKRARGRGRP